MKTTNFWSMTQKLGVLSLTALMIASCGSNSDDNGNSNNSSSSNPFNGNNSPVFGDSSSSGSAGSTWNDLKGQFNCQQGRSSDRTFHFSNANLVEGSISGDHQSSYYGKNANGDLIYIGKVSQGGSLAYNVVFSFCNYSDGYASYIGDNAQMSQFTLYNTVINDNGSCSTGEVEKATLSFYNPALQGNYNFPGGMATVEFTGICN